MSKERTYIDKLDEVLERAKRVVEGLPPWMKRCQDRAYAEYLERKKAEEAYEKEWEGE